MPDEIQPALTPEEWKAFAHDGAWIDCYAEPGESRGSKPFRTMAIGNAALPDDDPRKITRGDVRNVEDAIGTIMMGVRVETLSVQGLWDLAAKLAALLPPND